MSATGHPRHLDLSAALQYVGLPFAILLAWEALSQAGIIRRSILPPPTRVLVTFVELLCDGQLLKHVCISILRVLEGSTAAAVLGIGLGIAVGLSRTLAKVTDLVIQVLKPIPPLAWIPMAILWFGIGELSKVYLIFLGAFFPILINSIDAIRQTDGKFVELARVLEVPRGKFILQVVIPGAFPAFMTGIRIGISVAWMCVVAAELIAASSGIGYMIMDARQLSQPDVVIVGMITIGVVGKLMDTQLKRLEGRLIRWKVTYDGE